MTPEVEIQYRGTTKITKAWFPAEVSQAQLEKALEDSGGKVIKWERIPGERIPAGIITINHLKDFLWGHPFFEEAKGRGGVTMFEVLRANLSVEEQEKLLVQFFTQEVDGFPNGEKIAKFLAEVGNNMSFSQPQQLPSEDVLLGHVHEYLERSNPYSPHDDARIGHSELNIPFTSISLRTISDFDSVFSLYHFQSDWVPWEHWDFPAYLIHEVVRSSKRKLARDMAYEAVEGAVWSALKIKGMKYHDTAKRSGALVASLAVEWMVIEDEMKKLGFSKGNPFEPLWEIYKLGCLPVGMLPFENVYVHDRSGKPIDFVVYVPPIAF